MFTMFTVQVYILLKFSGPLSIAAPNKAAFVKTAIYRFSAVKSGMEVNVANGGLYAHLHFPTVHFRNNNHIKCCASSPLSPKLNLIFLITTIIIIIIFIITIMFIITTMLSKIMLSLPLPPM